jgi:hypothetical protein
VRGEGGRDWEIEKERVGGTECRGGRARTSGGGWGGGRERCVEGILVRFKVLGAYTCKNIHMHMYTCIHTKCCILSLSLSLSLSLTKECIQQLLNKEMDKEMGPRPRHRHGGERRKGRGA